MTRDGKAWLGDQVRDEVAERDGIVTDIRQGLFVLRPLYRSTEEWTADSDEQLTVTVPREDRQF
ncbi:hypothetical protein [Streptomyces sp. NPDC049040]|uniref:hypothetical protein n=1 Tax=Streptomyces sp. NPDC049040 TaxID=3365593 RepID=UPI0037236D24